MHAKKEATLPPTPQQCLNVKFSDSVLDDAMEQMNVPQTEGKANETFERHQNAALRFSWTQPRETEVKSENPVNDLDSFMTQSQGKCRNDEEQPLSYLPMADRFTDCIAYQWLRNQDLD
jgi:hypothetical protein